MSDKKIFFFAFDGNVVFMTMIVITASLKCSNCIEMKEDINDICETRSERYLNSEYNMTNILHTYKTCLQALQRYSGSEREQLLSQLMNRLECLKEDIKQSFYSGSTKYKDMKMVEKLLEEIHFVDTNLSSESWQNEKEKCNLTRMARSTVKRIIPLVLTGTMSEKKRACDTIFKKGGSNTTEFENIPTPQLDSETNPKQLTLPLKSSSSTTYKVDSPEAENALTEYYTVVMKCLTLTTEHKVQVFKFNRKFYDWLTKNVLPHLTDDKCYPAFGGVLQIVETMRQNDFVPKNTTANFLFYRQKDLGKTEEEQRKEKDSKRNIFFQPYFMLILTPWLLFIFIFILFMLWKAENCVGWGHKSFDTISSESNESAERFYFPIDETPSASVNIEDDTLEPNYSYHGSEGSNKSLRQRGGENFPLYLPVSMFEGENSSLISLPLKRHLSSRDTPSSSYQKLTSPGKRPRNI